MIKGDDLRYSRLGDIIQVVFRMQGTQAGLTLEDICEELNVARRTAERIRDAILRNFPQIGELSSKDSCKRWGITNWHGRRTFLSGLIGFTENEILVLEQLKKLSAGRGDGIVAESLTSITNKIRALMRYTEENEKFQTDNLKLLIESEGYAVSQFPQHDLALHILVTIRHGLRESVTLIFQYTNRKGIKSQREVKPYGILYSHNNYLVAKDGLIKLFDLSRIEDLKLGENFTRDETFNLTEFANRSFGIYQETPLEVTLLFAKNAADDVLKYHFHPTQSISLQENGEVEVRFKAGGTMAIFWELFRWGDHVRILGPKSLKEAYAQELKKILSVQIDGDSK